MRAVAWHGHVVETDFLNVSSGIEWAMITNGQQTKMASWKPCLTMRKTYPRISMGVHGTDYLPLVIHSVKRMSLDAIIKGDVTPFGVKDATDFKHLWMGKNRVAHFSIHETAWVHEFSILDTYNDLEAMRNVVEALYPSNLS